VNRHQMILAIAVFCVFVSGCNIKNIPPDPPEVIQGIQNTTSDVGTAVSGAGEQGITTVDSVGSTTGVKNVIKGVGKAVVDTSENIGQEQKGKVMGKDMTIFPPEAEEDGKVIKIDF